MSRALPRAPELRPLTLAERERVLAPMTQADLTGATPRIFALFGEWWYPRALQHAALSVPWKCRCDACRIAHEGIARIRAERIRDSDGGGR